MENLGPKEKWKWAFERIKERQNLDQLEVISLTSNTISIIQDETQLRQRSAFSRRASIFSKVSINQFPDKKEQKTCRQKFSDFMKNKTENFSVYKHSKKWMNFDWNLTAFWLNFDWILTAFDCTVTEIWQHFDCILAYFDWILTFLDWILTEFWLHYESILTEFWQNFDSILTEFWLNFGCFLTAF